MELGYDIFSRQFDCTVKRPFYGTIDQLDKFFLPCYRSYLRAITVKTIYAKIVFLTLKTYAKRTNCVNESPFFKHKKNCFKSS